jgi:hypothetical protein
MVMGSVRAVDDHAHRETRAIRGARVVARARRCDDDAHRLDARCATHASRRTLEHEKDEQQSASFSCLFGASG